MMDVIVKFFAVLRDEAGVEGCRLLLESGASGLEVRARLSERYTGLGGWLEYCRLAVNLEYQPWEVVLHEGDELSLIPPVSGG